MFENKTIAQVDPELWGYIQDEQRRQEDHIELIASENYTSPTVMQAQGSCLTNKYAEGYPGHRYYGGCENVDSVERLAIARAKALFCEPLGVDMMVNVQPHSGAQANMAAFMAVLQPGDTVMGMSLADGGHLSHGMRLNYSGRYFRVVSYGLKQDETIDYDEVERLALEHKPKLIVAGASAYSLKIDFERFAQIAHKVGALLMADIAHYAALVAGGVYPTPFGFADIVTTTTHKSLRGPRGGVIFARPELEKAINSAVFPGTQGGPLMHVIAAKAVAFGEALKPEFKTYAAQIVTNAKALAETLESRGLRIVSGGTESHVMLVDLRSKGVTGREAQDLLGRANITVNKNAIHNDPQKPTVTSGIRLGTPAATTRGFKEGEMVFVGNLIADLLDSPTNDAVLNRVHSQVLALTERFPVYSQNQGA
ncbi:MAG: serine hydroxymethyltransferase [Sutterella sp.]|nr:serine hydroxymethyltransferase [Sutterella sp.]MDY3272887.1 serine hydroxymethyltransferase [Duodenibacillus sp.]